MSCRRSAQDDAEPSQTQPDTDDEADPEEAAADSLAAGDSGALEPEGGTSGSQCKHKCCGELKVCILAELELVRGAYSVRGTDQFRAKVSSTAYGWLFLCGVFSAPGPAFMCCTTKPRWLGLTSSQQYGCEGSACSLMPMYPVPCPATCQGGWPATIWSCHPH